MIEDENEKEILIYDGDSNAIWKERIWNLNWEKDDLTGRKAH